MLKNVCHLFVEESRVAVEQILLLLRWQVVGVD